MNIETRERLLLLEILMTDIRMDWSIPPKSDIRVKRAIELAATIWADTAEISGTTRLRLNMWQTLARLAAYSAGRYEGRWLKESFTSGGYQGMGRYHDLPLSPHGRSQWLQDEVKKLVKTNFKWEV